MRSEGTQTHPWFRRVCIREAKAVKRLPRATGQVLPREALHYPYVYTDHRCAYVLVLSCLPQEATEVPRQQASGRFGPIAPVLHTLCYTMLLVPAA